MKKHLKKNLLLIVSLVVLIIAVGYVLRTASNADIITAPNSNRNSVNIPTGDAALHVIPKDGNYENISGTSVTVVVKSSSGATDTIATPDAYGDYAAALPAGTYTVTVVAHGYQSQTKTVTLAAQTTTEEQFVMTQ